MDLRIDGEHVLQQCVRALVACLAGIGRESVQIGHGARLTSCLDLAHRHPFIHRAPCLYMPTQSHTMDTHIAYA
jgi:hypothetical protein